MTKYQEGIIYIGNIMEYKNGKVREYRKNIYLIYEEKGDKFLSFQDVLNPSIDLLNTNLTTEQKKEIENKINNYKYPYTLSNQEGEKYIDESSIQVLEYQDKNKSRS